MLCSTCTGVLQQLKGLVLCKDTMLMLLHHDRARDLKAAAEAGCRFCYTFWDQLTDDQQQQFLSTDDYYITPQEAYSLPPVELDDNGSWQTRMMGLRNYATLCQINPGEEYFKAAGGGCICFSIIINPDWSIPQYAESQDQLISLLQPVSESLAFGW